MCKQIKFIAYHATKKKNAPKIKTNGFRESNKSNEWLGDGIYFFQYRKDAETWGNFVENERYIFCCELECDNKYFLDLDNPDHYKMIYDYEQIIHNKLQENQAQVSFKGRAYTCYIINLYKKEKEIKLIKHTFNNSRTQQRLNNNFENSIYKPKEVQLCATDNTIITQIIEN